MSETEWNARVRVLSGYAPTAVSGGRWMMSPVEVTFTRDDIDVIIEVAAHDGVPSCAAYTVRSRTGGGLEGQSTTIARGIKLREMLEMAAGAATMGARTEGEGFSIHSWEPAPQPGTDLGAMTRRRNRPVTDETLEEFAAKFKHWRDAAAGPIEEFARSVGYSPRHAHRLLAEARHRGLLEDK